MKNIFFLLVFALLYACGDAPPARTRQPRRIFRTTAPSHLYFKNMRSVYYQQSVKPGTQIDVYILKKFSVSLTQPSLFPVIEDNWLEDEAYILLEKNPYISDPLLIKWGENESVDSITIHTLRLEQHYPLTKQIFESLKRGHKVSVYTTSNEWQLLYENPTERLGFLTIMKDYYNLTEASLH